MTLGQDVRLGLGLDGRGEVNRKVKGFFLEGRVGELEGTVGAEWGGEEGMLVAGEVVG